MCVGKWSGSGLEGSCVDLVWSTTGLGCVSASGLEVVWKGLVLI